MSLTRKLSSKSLIKQNTSQDLSNSANQTITKDTFTASGLGPYSLTVSPGSVNNTQVYVNGVYQEKNNYTLNNNQITFTSPGPPAGTSIEVVSGSSYNIGTPSDGSVTTVKISSGAASAGSVLTANGIGGATFTNTLPTVQRLTSTGTTVGYLFTASTTVNVVQNEVYQTPNLATFTVVATLTGTNLVWMTGASAPNAASSTLTRITGSAPGATTPITYTAFQTLATYTTPANVKYIKVRMAGGGGGGGGSGGSGNGSNGGSGTAGTLSVFGSSLLIANGGGAGLSNGTNLQGGAGGAVTVNSPAINIASQQGGEGEGQGAAINAGYNRDPGADGGDTPFFGGGGKRSGSDSAGSTGLTNTGGGGQSGGFGPTGGLWIGSGGGSGGYVEAVIPSPSASYLYSIGAGGTGGTAGTSGYAGGAGGSGVIIVEEYYT